MNREQVSHEMLVLNLLIVLHKEACYVKIGGSLPRHSRFVSLLPEIWGNESCTKSWFSRNWGGRAFSQPHFSTLLYSQLLMLLSATLLSAMLMLLSATLLYPTLLSATLLYPTLLSATLLYPPLLSAMIILLSAKLLSATLLSAMLMLLSATLLSVHS